MSKVSSPAYLEAKIEDGPMIMLDKASMAAGANSKLICKAGQKMTIKFPVKPAIAKWTGSLKTAFPTENVATLSSMDGFTMMMDSAKLACVKVLGRANFITF